jgi:hypothetical protein
VVGPDAARLVVDVKGRRFPGGSADAPRKVWQNWTDGGDLDGLSRWAEHLGPGFRGVLAFVFHIAPPFELPADAPDRFAYRGQTYLMRAVAVADYKAHARPRSPRWGTVHLSTPDFARLVRPFSWFLSAQERTTEAQRTPREIHTEGSQELIRVRFLCGFFPLYSLGLCGSFPSSPPAPMNRFKLGLVLETTGLTVRRGLAEASRAGADGVQIDAAGDLAPDALTATGRREFRNLLKTYNLDLAALNCPLRRGLDVADNLQQRVDYVRKVMQLAFDLGARKVVAPLVRVPTRPTRRGRPPPGSL